MNSFRKILAVLLCVSFLTFLCACEISLSKIGEDKDDTVEKESGTDKDKDGKLSAKKAAETAEDFIKILTSGDLSAVNEMLPLGNLLYQDNDSSLFSGGIINEIIASLTYTVEEKTALEDGTVLIKLKIENTDLKELLLALPESIASKEEAREKMVELRPTAPRKIFNGELILSYAGKDVAPKVSVTPSFVNAITGGLNDIITELIMEEMANESIN